MARSAGVEPATARFVAEYSIQLSYERKNRLKMQTTTLFILCRIKNTV